jgi:carbon storage regulator CsrA
MLVLTRKQGEQIRIGADVVITVVRTKGKAVRLGIQAPAHVPVLRGEIAVAIAEDEEHKAASGEEHDDEPWPGGVESSGGVLKRVVAMRAGV